MTAEEIKHTLDILHKQKIEEEIKQMLDNLHNNKYFTCRGNGYEITYNPQTNIYICKSIFFNGVKYQFNDGFEMSEADLIAKLNAEYEKKFETMTIEKIKHILDTLHNNKDHTSWDFDSASGDPWSGYTRNGYEITYYPETNTYTWRYAFDNGFTSIEYDEAFEISEADLIAKLATINYTI